jgi:hypothetical protein
MKERETTLSRLLSKVFSGEKQGERQHETRQQSHIDPVGGSESGSGPSAGSVRTGGRSAGEIEPVFFARLEAERNIKCLGYSAGFSS